MLHVENQHTLGCVGSGAGECVGGHRGRERDDLDASERVREEQQLDSGHLLASVRGLPGAISGQLRQVPRPA